MIYYFRVSNVSNPTAARVRAVSLRYLPDNSKMIIFIPRAAC